MSAYYKYMIYFIILNNTHPHVRANWIPMFKFDNFGISQADCKVDLNVKALRKLVDVPMESNKHWLSWNMDVYNLSIPPLSLSHTQFRQAHRSVFTKVFTKYRKWSAPDTPTVFVYTLFFEETFRKQIESALQSTTLSETARDKGSPLTRIVPPSCRFATTQVNGSHRERCFDKANTEAKKVGDGGLEEGKIISAF